MLKFGLINHLFKRRSETGLQGREDSADRVFETEEKHGDIGLCMFMEVHACPYSVCAA